MEVDTEIAKLRILEAQYKKNLFALQDKIRKNYPEDIARQEKMLERTRADIKMLSEIPNPEVFEISVNGQIFTDRKEGARALTDALYESKCETTVAEFRGFKISMNPMAIISTERTITLTGAGQYILDVGASASGNLTRIENFIEEFPKREEKQVARLEQLMTDLAFAKEEVKKPFEQQERLTELVREQIELNTELDLNRREEVVIDENESADESTGAESYSELPDHSTIKTSKPKPRKALDKGTLRLHKKIKDEEPQTVVFIENGDFFDLMGEDAELVGERFDKTPKDGLLTLPSSELDQIVRSLVDDGNKIKIIEKMPEKMEVNFIDEEVDEVAAMPITVLPDYTVSQEEMHEYGYKWDGALPIRANTARLLYQQFNLDLYRLYPDDTEAAVDDGTFDDDVLYMIEKPEWDAFIKSPPGKYYLATRLQILNATDSLVSHEMDYFPAVYTDTLSDNLNKEKPDLTAHLAPEKDFDTEEMKPYVRYLLDYFIGRFDRFPLAEYGWDSDDVCGGIAEAVEDDEIRNYADGLADDRHFRNYLDQCLDRIEWLNGRHTNFDDEEIARLIVELKESMLETKWDISNDLYPVDEWYEELTNTRIRPFLQERRFDIDKELENIPTEELEDYLETYPDKDEEGYAVSEFLSATKLDDVTFDFEGDQIVAKDGLGNEWTGKDFYEFLLNEVVELDEDHKLVEGYGIDQLFVDRLIECSQRYGAEIYPVTEKPVKERLITSIEREYDAFKKEELKKPESSIFDNHTKIHFFTEMYFFLSDGGDDYLHPTDYEALIADVPNVLSSLYDFYLNAEYASVNNWSETAELIENYNNRYHADAAVKRYEVPEETTAADGATFFGRDTENTAYYRLEKRVNEDTLAALTEEGDDYVIAAPGCDLTDEQLQEKNIFFLQIGRDIPEDQLRDPADAIRNMQIAVDNVTHQKAEAWRQELHTNIACRDAIDKGIRENFNGMTLKTGFEDEIIEKFGLDRVIFVLATTVDDKEWDGRFSPKTKEWAKEKPVTHGADRNYIISGSHPAVLDGFITRIREIENEKKEEQMPEQSKEKATWLKTNVARDAMFKSAKVYSLFRMPSNGEYAGYAYSFYNNRIKESSQLTDLESDSRELSYELSLPENDTVNLFKRDADDIVLSASEFIEAVGNTTAKDYATQDRADTKQWFSFSLPTEAMRGMYENSSLFSMPNGSEYAGSSYYLPNSFIQEDKKNAKGDHVEIRIPEDLDITLKDRTAGAEKKISARDLQNICQDTSAEDYKFTPQTAPVEEKSDEPEWKYLSVSNRARIAQYEERSLFKMPNGEYGNYAYYIPNKLLKDNAEKETIRIGLPPDFVIHLKDGRADKTLDMTPDEFSAAVKGASADDYGFRAEETASAFDKRKEMLDSTIPEEMKSRPNWVVVRTRKNETTGKLEKFLVDCHTGSFAKSDDPATWTDYNSACVYARDKGGVALAYALDGKDKIACIDLDHCVSEDGTLSPLAEEVKNACGKMFCERSISGSGLHFFGKTDGMDVRTFSKDGDMEFYQKSHFISMTGDLFGESEAALTSFDAAPVKQIIQRKCDRRSEWHGVGKGVEGLSAMSDREVVDKAISAKHGDTFKALYNGQDLQNNHSNSDMSLMNRLAFWCNGDKEQMLRIFATSGLYRPDKSPDYYECTAIKAIKDTNSRFQPPEQTPMRKPPENNRSGGFGKA